MHRPRRLVRLTFALSACAAPTTAVPTATRIEVPAPPSSAMKELPEPSLDPILNPPVPVCTLVADDVPTRYCDRPWIALAANAEGLEPTVLVAADTGVKLRFELALGAAAAFVRFAAANVEVRGYVPLANLKFQLRKAATALDGHATMIAGSTVQVRPPDNAGIHVEGADDVLDLRSIDFRTSCDALGYAPYAENAELDDSPNAPSYAVPTVHALPLALRAGGPSVVTLAAPDEEGAGEGEDETTHSKSAHGTSANGSAPLDVTLGVVGREGGDVHVLLHGQRTTFDGWVQGAQIATTHVLHGRASGLPGMCGVIRDDMGSHHWFTVTEDTRAIVGPEPVGPVAKGVLFKAGAEVEIRRSVDGWADVRPGTEVVRAAENGRLWLPVSALKPRN